MAVLEAKNLVKQYDLGDHSVVALAGVDIVIENGEFVAIMGPSGSGKSTLLHLLGGLDQPSQGEVFIANHRMSVLDDTQATLVRRHNVGFVFQFFNLLPNLTAEENINLPIIIDGQNPRDYEGKLTTLLRLVGLSDRRNHKPDQLSGGEQQRVSMARALLTEPAVLLADEPTGNLDSKTSMAIMELLQRSCRELHQATIVVSHDPKAAAYADRVIFLQDGEIINEIALARDMKVPDRRRVINAVLEELEE